MVLHEATVACRRRAPHRSPGHSLRMARSGDRSQSRPRRAASATAAVRVLRPSLWRMFATWRCTVCWLKTNCSAISWSLNPPRPTPTPRALDRRATPPQALRHARRSLGRERRTQRACHRRPITGPRKVGAPVERDQRRGRDPRRELAAELIGDRAIATAVHDQRGRTYLIQLRSNVVAVRQLQQHRRSLRARRLALVARHSLLFDAVGCRPRRCRPAAATPIPNGSARLRRSTRAPPATSIADPSAYAP